MENLKEAALYFEELKNYSYKINLIKKKKQYELNIIFRDCDFWHAVGLGEQARIEEFKCNKGSLYQRILADDQTLFDILDSSEGFYEEMYVERRKDFLLIKQCLESDSVVFKSVGKLKGSKIKCDFIISAELDVCNEGKEVVKKKYWIFFDRYKS
ncbi:PBECR4 domain-containing protein [Erysipelothrix rhusiopathiae]|nr:PBECR4 domain-containing protein [Erysipelothrix rhusiopathiae]